MSAFMLIASACTFSVGVLMLFSAWTVPADASRRVNTVDHERIVVRVAGSLFTALVLLALTGWAVATLVGAALGWKASGAWLERRLGRRSDQDRIEALAGWCEQLRDLLCAEHGILGTVAATVPTCPEAIRPEVARLATRVERQSAETAVRHFAVEVDDPSGDLIASVLLLAMSHSGRTSELLGELATTIRDRAAMRLRVEAERSGQRAEGRFVIGFSVVVILAVTLFGRGSRFLDAYDGTLGQTVLAIVASMFGVGAAWLSRLTRFQRPARFLTVGAAT